MCLYCPVIILKRIMYRIHRTIFCSVVVVGTNSNVLFWSEKCVIDHCFRRLLGRMFHKKRSSAHDLSFFFLKGRGIPFRSLESREASKLPTSFRTQDILLVTLTLSDANAMHFSFTFLMCQSTISQNTIDF